MEAAVEATLHGARGHHAIDVAVRFTGFGIEQLWIVECKLWQSGVPKEKVMALRDIMEDVGADRAFLLSESGFQSGAVTVARFSSITLTDLDDLRVNAAGDLQGLRWQELYDRVARCSQRFDELSVTTDRSNRGLTTRYKPGTADDLFFYFGNLGQIEHGLERAKTGQTPMGYSRIRGEGTILAARDVDTFLERAAEVLEEIEAWVEERIAEPWPDKPAESTGPPLIEVVYPDDA